MRKINYTVKRSDRKTVALQIRDGVLTVKAPMKMTDREIFEFVEKHRHWIEKHLADYENKSDAEEPRKLTDNEIAELKKKAMRIIPPRVAELAERIGVKYGKITVRNQKTRWGSCSAKGNLSFNCLLVLVPEPVLDSVIIHELCHIKEMNHSSRFYREVYSHCPDYEEHREWLKNNGSKLLIDLKKV